MPLAAATAARPPPRLPAHLPLPPPSRRSFLQQNALVALAPGVLAALPQLDTLNVGGNALASLDGLAGCAQLRTLVACDNALVCGGALAALATCTQLESVDLQNNKLEDGEAALALLRGLPHLKCLYLRGNPLVSSLHRRVLGGWVAGQGAPGRMPAAVGSAAHPATPLGQG